LRSAPAGAVGRGPGRRQAAAWHHRGVNADARVCPFCGEPPGVGVFCEACGRNLAAVEQLPTRAEWEGLQPVAEERPPADGRTVAEATAAFLSAMHAAGDPGALKLPMSGATGFRRQRHADAWVVRAVGRDEDDEDYSRYEPGLVLTKEGRYHRLASEVRGWGTRDFPMYRDIVDPDPIEMPDDERLVGELVEVLRANGADAAF